MDRCRKYLYAFPFLLFIGIFYLYGLFYGILNSFGYYRVVGESFFTLEFYKKILENKALYSTLVFTAKISFISAVISLVFSIVIIYFLYINIKKKLISPNVIQKLIESPLLVPYLIGAYAVLIVFMQNGILSTLFQKLGWIESYQQFPILTNDRNGVGIIITYVWKTIPFITMMSMPTVKRISNRWDPLARVYNLGSFGFFRKIVLPLIAPTLVISFFIILSYFFIAFETPYLLGVTHPKSLAVYIYDIYSRGSLEERGYVMAMNIAISLFSLAIGGFIAGLLKIFSKLDEKGWG